MAETPKMKKSKQSSDKTPKQKLSSMASPDHRISPRTPKASAATGATSRRSLRFNSQTTPASTTKHQTNYKVAPPLSPATISITPISPQPTESKKRKKLQDKRYPITDKRKILRSSNSKKNRNANIKVKKRVYYKKVVYDESEFAVADDVYLKRREDATSDEEDADVEECRVCFKPAGRQIMIECDDCLNGFHLKCLKPPLKEVPEGDFICNYCEGRKSGKLMEFPEPPKGKKRIRTAREKLLSSNLWAACIESLWKEMDGTYWFRARWYIIPEETAAGRQPHNLKRELYRTNDFADVEFSSYAPVLLQ